MKKIDVLVLLYLITEYDGVDGVIYKGWSVVSKVLDFWDEGDGGGHYTLVLKDGDGLFYQTHYCDWDLIVDGTSSRCDLDCSLTGVEPVEVIVTQWKIKNN